MKSQHYDSNSCDSRCLFKDVSVFLFQDLTVPEHVMTVINEELNKLSTLDNHSSEFK